MLGSKCARKRRKVQAATGLPRACKLGCGQTITNRRSIVCQTCSNAQKVCEDCGHKCGYKRPVKLVQKLPPGLDCASAPLSLVPPLSNDEVQKRAFELFARRGYVHGFDVADYYEAERQLKVEKLAYLLFVRRGCLHGFDRDDYFEAERLVNAASAAHLA